MTKLINAVHIKGLYYILNTSNLNLSSGICIDTLTANELYTNKVFKETKIMNYIK